MTRSGVVSIAGRPNVGKSTLLNRLIGQKLSITAHKPQTTRHTLIGVHTVDDVQIAFVDTPGIHVGARQKLNQVLNRTASGALHGVDLALLLVQAPVFNDDDQRAFDTVVAAEVPFLIVVNKIDTVTKKAELLPYLEQLPTHERCLGIRMISARKGDGVPDLEAAITERMPEGVWQYGADDLTDRSARFLAAESVREQLTRLLTAELPYALTVEIETFEDTTTRDGSPLYRIGAVVWVDKASQKGIVIGKGGERLKEVGRRARESMQTLFERRIFLELWVRVKEGWADDERALASLGYDLASQNKRVAKAGGGGGSDGADG